MKIDEKILLNKLNEISKKNNIDLTKCPICHNNSLIWNSTLFEIREYNSGNLVIGKGASLIPAIIATCQKCGAMVPFNAITLGLVDPKTGNVIGSDKNGQKEKK
ncbi:hypothetical protein [Marinitoga lauensis]|uniref:hypothetical protein n=1 Tax=Marinitoga lauensis TaxID=2201189 RepID=UPI001011A246|nr:hypothetical protein [Marinitoga lauensis]